MLISLGLAALLLVRLVLRLSRRRAVAVYQPRPHVAPDPYFSHAAMDDYKEKHPLGSAGFSASNELHQALQGAYRRGEPPRFKE